MESHIFAWGNERTHMKKPALMGARARAFLDKHTGKVYPPSPPIEGKM